MKKSKLIAMLALAIFSVFSLSLPALAAEHLGSGKTHLLVSPTKQRVPLEPGTSYKGSFEVHNAGQEDFSYTVYATPYTIMDESYNVSYEDKNQYSYIADWVTFSQTEGHLNPDEEQVINFTVDVPLDAPGGGQYAAFMVETADTRDQHNIGVINRVGMVFYASVSGETNRCAKILDNKINGFTFAPPITATSLVENCGNVHGDIEYTLRVWPLFSDEEIYTNEENPDSKIILPGTRRFATTAWDNAPSIGLYWTEHTVKIFNETSTVHRLVIICPLWLIVLIVAFIIAVIFHFVSRHKARKAAKTEKEASKNS